MELSNLDQNQLVLLNIFLLGRQIRKKIKHENPAKMLNNAILILVETGSQTVSSLAKIFSISLSTASEKINKLQRQGLISFTPSQDKRSNLLALTSQGKDALSLTKEHFAQQAKLVLAGITPSEQQTFLTVLQKLQLNLERKN